MPNVSLKIVFENENVVLVDKPAGWLSRPSRFGLRDERPCVSSELAKTRSELWVVHRLDIDVSGLLLFAKNKSSHRALSQAWEAHEVQKKYHALAHRLVAATTVEPEIGELETWEHLIAEGKRRSFLAEHGKKAITRAICVKVENRVHHWLLEPVTGRRHQLRVQMVARGFVILGDVLYGGANEQWKSGIALRAVRLDFKKLDLSKDLKIPDHFEIESLSL
ncbi:MAG TPA: RNA pseudouridine synthase [Oligoflexia bacterium]|nr:RNA pseudouridine synthase [Oligoflexia bacterium]